MKRLGIVIVGNSGAGKSTLAKAIAQRLSLLHLDLDTVVFDPAQIGVMRPAADIEEDLTGLVNGPQSWVAEGSYGSWAQWLAAHASHFLFLNPPIETCLAHHAARPWEPHKYESPEEQAARLPMLEAWVRSYEDREDQFGQGAHRAAFDGAGCAKLELLSASEAWDFLGEADQ